MRYKVITVRDRAIDTFGVPMFVANLGGAIRSFGDEIKRVDPANQMNKHPEDFDLYFLGEYDDESGQFENLAKPQQIAVGKDYI